MIHQINCLLTGFEKRVTRVIVSYKIREYGTERKFKLKSKYKQLLPATTFHNFRLLRNGLQVLGDPSLDEWIKCGRFIKSAEGAVHWWIGDWIRHGEHAYGEKYTQYIDELGFDYGTLRNDVFVAERIDLSRRRDKLSFAHHQEVARFEPKEQDELLDKAEKLKVSIRDLRQMKHRMLLEMKRPVESADANLHLGDCLEIIKTIPDNSIDLLLTDPPYGIDFQSNHRMATPRFDKLPNDSTPSAELLEALCRRIEPKLKINSHVYIFTSWKVESQFRKVVSRYFNVKNILVWEKNNWSMGDLEGNYAEQYEQILFAEKGRRHLNGNRDSNILKFDRVTDLQHPTEKPVPLLKFLIEKSTQKGETVLDPFMGSGSTCVAAKQSERKHVGIEIDKQWFNLAQHRIATS